MSALVEDHGLGDLHLLREVSGGSQDTGCGLALEPLGEGLFGWVCGEQSGIAEGLDEGILALGRAIGERYGSVARKNFLLDMVKALL